MMNYIQYTKEEDYTPQQAQNEYIEILVKAGRRCAYDLQHAADYMTGDDDFKKLMYDRASHWQSVFTPAADGKNYRHHLHHVIMNLEVRIELLMRRLADNNIDVSDLTEPDIPF